MNQDERQGCFTAILRLIGISLGSSEKARELPYRQRDDFLSAAELSFYRVLSAAIGNRAVICPKVNQADIFFVARPNENQSFRNKIDRKHVDFGSLFSLSSSMINSWALASSELCLYCSNRSINR